MERRLQLLLDQQRFALVEREAQATGRSIAAVIREAIDVRFADDVALRRTAARRLLDATAEAAGVEPEWPDAKAAYEAEQAARFEQIP